MTEAEALYQFFNSFGMNGYPSTSDLHDAVYPWLTYENTYDLPFSEPVGIAVNLWYHTESEAEPNKKVKEIAERVGQGGIQIHYDEGTILVRAGRPFAIAVNDQNDASVKGRQINLTLEYM